MAVAPAHGARARVLVQPPKPSPNKYAAFMAKRCRRCLGTYAADLQAWAEHVQREHGAPACTTAMSRGLACTAKATPLAMHIIEREHGHTHKDIRASKQLGKALGPPDVSAIHVLRDASEQHTAAHAPRIPISGACLAAPGQAAGPKRPAAYARCSIKRNLLRLRCDDVKGKRSFKYHNVNGWAIFRGEYTRREWPQVGGGVAFTMPIKNALWNKRLSRSWWDLHPSERAQYRARARTLNTPWKQQRATQRCPQPPGPAASPHPAPVATRGPPITPWRMGDSQFPVTPAELLAADDRCSIAGTCPMIEKSPELAAQIDAAVGAMEKSLPCWRQGFCHATRQFSMGKIINAHRALQSVFLTHFGTDFCRSGDALVYFRGRPSPHHEYILTPSALEIFALITSQCLAPRRSTLLLLLAPTRETLQPADRVHCYTGAGRAGATELPPELQIIAPTAPPARVTPSSWCFRISTGLAHKLLTLTQKYNVSWDVSLIDYTHRTPNGCFT